MNPPEEALAIIRPESGAIEIASDTSDETVEMTDGPRAAAMREKRDRTAAEIARLLAFVKRLREFDGMAAEDLHLSDAMDLLPEEVQREIGNTQVAGLEIAPREAKKYLERAMRRYADKLKELAGIHDSQSRAVETFRKLGK